MKKRLWLVGFASVASICVVASCLAYGGTLRLEALGVPHIDFVGHLVFMGLLACFADGMLGHRAVARTVRLGPALVLAAAATDEVLQRFSIHRSSSWSDFVADAIGVTLGAFVATRITRAYAEAAIAP